MLESELRRADDAIGEEERAIAAERKRIEQLEAEGHPTTLATRTLRIMQRTLDAYRHHRRILLERVGLY